MKWKGGKWKADTKKSVIYGKSEIHWHDMSWKPTEQQDAKEMQYFCKYHKKVLILNM